MQTRVQGPVAVVALAIAVSAPALAAGQNRQAAAPQRGDSVAVRGYADLDRLSDLVLQLDELRADGADDVILADARARIAAELRLDPSEQEPLPDRAARGGPGAGQAAGDRRDRQGQRVGGQSGRNQAADRGAEGTGDRHDQRLSQRVRAREAQIVARKRELIQDLRLLQLRIDAGTDDTPALEADQDTMLNEYLALTREEIRLGLRESGEGQGERGQE